MSAPNEEATQSGNAEPLPISDAVLAELKRKYPGELRLYESDGDVVVVRAPTRGEYKRYRQQIHNANERPIANETLFLSCAVYPDKVLEQVLDRRPGLADVWGDLLSTWAGVGAATTEKKL